MVTGRLRKVLNEASARHQRAVGRVGAARAALDQVAGGGAVANPPAYEAATARMADAAQRVPKSAEYLRVGEFAHGSRRAPVIVPFLGSQQLATDVDTRDPRVVDLLREVLLQLFTGSEAGALRVRTVDAAGLGAAFAPFRPLIDAGALGAPVTDQAGYRDLLDQAENHVRARLSGETGPVLVLVIASAPPHSRADAERLDALARSGASAGLQVIACGVPALAGAVRIGLREGYAEVSGGPFGEAGLAARVTLAAAPSLDDMTEMATRLAERERKAATIGFTDLVPTTLWTERADEGLRTVVGRGESGPAVLSFDDATPHWLVGGRSGGGKTVFLLDVLYGLAARYSPDELALYLLDFKEGVSFTEFTPSELDPSWIPHARAVGIESDREYGVAILRELTAEMTRRSVAMKRAGVTRYAQLRVRKQVPRVVLVIDEFHVLFQGNDKVAREAVALLEDLARKGRSYGIHMVLASQTVSGIEALYTKKDSIFGQFPLRVALPGANSVLDVLNSAAAGLRIGEAIVNPAGGIKDHNRLLRFPNAHDGSGTLDALRHRLWEHRAPGSPPPPVFQGYAEQVLEKDSAYLALAETAVPRALVGRAVDLTGSTAGVTLDAGPGRHLAVLGADPVGAEVLSAAARSVAKQRPGARFLFVGATAPEIIEDAVIDIGRAGASVARHPMTAFPDVLASLAEAEDTYLVGFGLDAASLDRAQTQALSALLRRGPARRVHVLGWWRTMRRFTEDLGGSQGREDVACAVVLNIPGGELTGHFGQSVADWQPRPNRALLIDRHADTRTLILPFSREEEL
ncbi:cell division protein FtsK [Actinorhabdospora filicis]|uniref:Cell division protein FtsK n=1 Tax=Actinorhabdospora filicis TaxID=1785913 RepID=A0A9W6SL37_9ACTN|nr:FtsK/SpoIIIE domain-containing protein [Actinorhabdospora filicis]GLZ77731.1 cell division protein FtsK [Actinorhabdospora filicis]